MNPSLLDELRSYSDNELRHMDHFYSCAPIANLDAQELLKLVHQALTERDISTHVGETPPERHLG